jgi:HEAT repeat protein
VFKRFLLVSLALSLTGCPNSNPPNNVPQSPQGSSLVSKLHSADKATQKAARAELVGQGAKGAKTLVLAMKANSWNWHKNAKTSDGSRLQNISHYIRKVGERGVAEPVTDSLVAIGIQAMPALLDGLTGSSQCRSGTVYVLSRLDQDGVIKALQSTGLNSKDARKKEATLEALVLLGPRMKKILPALYETHQSKNVIYRIKAARAISAMTPKAREFLLQCAKHLRQTGKMDKAQFSAQLKASSLDPRSVVAGLHVFLEGRKYKQESLILLRLLKVLAKPVIPSVLIQTLGPPRSIPYVQALAQRTLVELDQKAVMSECINALKSNDAVLKHGAARYLALSRAPVDEAIPLLIASLKGGSRESSELCISAIVKSGPKAKPFLKQIMEANVEQASFSGALVGLLIKVDPDNTIERLLDGLKSANTMIRARSAECFRYYPNSPDRVMTVLVAALKDKEDAVITQLLYALATFGHRAYPFVDKVKAFLSEDQKTREYYKAADYAVGKISDPDN